MNTTEVRTAISQNEVRRMEDALSAAGIEFFRTGDTMNQITINLGTDDEPVYGSWKFTLHKSGWSLDDAVEEFESKLVERQIKEKQAAERKAKALADKEKREAKAKAKAEQAAVEKAFRQEELSRNAEKYNINLDK